MRSVSQTSDEKCLLLPLRLFIFKAFFYKIYMYCIYIIFLTNDVFSYKKLQVISQSVVGMVSIDRRPARQQSATIVTMSV